MKERSYKNSLIIGAVGGAADAFFAQPWYVWKTRIQFLYEHNKLIFKPEVLCRGLYANLITRVMVNSLTLLIQSGVKRFFFFNSREFVFTRDVFSSLCGGVGSSVISSISELGTVQQQRISIDRRAPSFLSTYYDLIKKFGWRRGAVGMPCTAVRGGCFSVATFAIIPFVNNWIQLYDVFSPKLTFLFSGFFAGAVSSFVSHPFDAIKTLQQSRAHLDTKSSFSFQNVSRDIYNKKGLKGFYAGFWFRCVRIVQGVSVLYYVTERLTHLYEHK